MDGVCNLHTGFACARGRTPSAPTSECQTALFWTADLLLSPDFATILYRSYQPFAVPLDEDDRPSGDVAGCVRARFRRCFSMSAAERVDRAVLRHGNHEVVNHCCRDDTLITRVGLPDQIAVVDVEGVDETIKSRHINDAAGVHRIVEGRLLIV